MDDITDNINQPVTGTTVNGTPLVTEVPKTPELPAIYALLNEGKTAVKGPDFANDVRAALLLADLQEAKANRIKQLAAVRIKFTKASADLAKIKPEPSGYDDNGKPIAGTSYNKAQAEERKKLQEQINQLTKAVDKALNPPNDWCDVAKLAGGDAKPE
jgi:hypothetical protein